jgi:Family of unknown function (DUF6282)
MRRLNGAPTRRARELLRGAYDTHVHIAPDVVEREIDDISLARRFAELGTAGFVLKSHYTSTAERASVVVVDESGAVLPETQTVLELVARHRLVLATGHPSRDEIFAVVDAAREQGITEIVITPS